MLIFNIKHIDAYKQKLWEQYKRIQKKKLFRRGSCIAIFALAIALNPYKVVANDTNPYHILVNKEHELPTSFVPAELVIPNIKFSFSGYHEKKYMEKEAAVAIELLFKRAKQEGIELVGVSGYRSYARQNEIYRNNVRLYGEWIINQTSAKPGHSEHQTGLAMDVSSKSNGYNLNQNFGKTKEGRWLAENAHLEGFIIRYPQGKQNLTGYTYEPWHIRYVGIELATYIKETGFVLEEIDFEAFGKQKVTFYVEKGMQLTQQEIEVVAREDGWLVPVRQLMDLLGASLQYNPTTKQIFIYKQHLEMRFNLEEEIIYVNGIQQQMRQSPRLINGSVYLPLEDLQEIFSYQLTQDKIQNIAFIKL
jgi:LAS superfamily LD-carboxypeptidase LdcB